MARANTICIPTPPRASYITFGYASSATLLKNQINSPNLGQPIGKD
jgi:hypothetical protein